MIFNRRSLIAMAGIALATTFAIAPSDARTSNFSVSGYNKLLKSGKPFLIGVHTTWCTSCAAQKRVINTLKQNKPYRGLRLVEMDWDKYRGSKIGRDLRIPRRSTLIMFNAKGKEVGRIIAGTGRSQIKRLIDKGI